MTEPITPAPAARPYPTTDGQTQSPSLTGDGTPAAAGAAFPFLAPPDRPGDLGRLGGYRVRRLLGEGGMGFVFHADDPGLQRPVALKVMRPEVAAKPSARDRFLREGRAAAAVKSDHVVTIHQVGEDGGVPFLAMEFLDGCSLDDWLKSRKGKVSSAAVAKVARDVLKGLSAAHGKGLVHRDIKPANLWVEKSSGRVKVLDFGLTRPQAEYAQLTQDGAVVGTPAYMAPEQAAGEPVDARADLFSLGVVLHAMLAGKSPFARPTVMATLTALATHAPPPAASLSGELPPGLAGLIDRLLARDPAARPASARAALEEWAAAEKLAKAAQVTATLPPGTPAAADPWAQLDADEPAPPRPQPAAPPTPPRRRRGLLIAAGLLGPLLAVALGVIIIKIKNKDGSETEVRVPDGATVTVEQNGKPVATVGPGPKKAEPVAAPQRVAQTDRQVAEWVLSVGGQMRAREDHLAQRRERLARRRSNGRRHHPV